MTVVCRDGGNMPAQRVRLREGAMNTETDCIHSVSSLMSAEKNAFVLPNHDVKMRNSTEQVVRLPN